MTTTKDIARHTGGALALTDDQTWWNKRQLAALEQIGVANATPGDQLVFLHVSQKTGLDPFARQIYMIGRPANEQDASGKWHKVIKQTIQTGIDGFRLIADRSDRRDGTAREYEDTQWCGADGVWTDAWTKGTAPAAAKVTVLRSGRRFSGVAAYREYVQTKKDGEPTGMWSKMPANQLAKCAEALALRKAYPQDLSGIYTDDEMGQAENTPPAAAPASSPGLAAVLGDNAEAPADDEVAEGEVVPDPGDLHDYVNDPEKGACGVVLSDGAVCGELEDRPPHVPAATETPEEGK